MKLTNLLCMGALSALVFTACVNNDDKSEWNDGSQPVSFTSSIQGVNSRAVDNKWSAGDKVGIFMKAAGGELSAATDVNKLYTTNDAGILTASNADNALYYPSNGSSVDFIAYYPYTASLANNTYVVNVANQTNQPAIDLLYSNNATGFAKGSANKPQLQFTHKLSQIVFNITKDATITNLVGLKVTFKGMNTTANFTLADGKLANAGTIADIAASVNESAATATTIVLPATALSNVKVVFELNGKSYTADYPQASLAEGSRYTHNVKLSDSNGQPVIEMEAATITNWITVPGSDIDVDFGDGGGVTPPTPGGQEQTIFEETFGTKDVSTVKVKINAYDGYDNQGVLTFFDRFAGEYQNGDIRSTSTFNNHVWFPASTTTINKSAALKISGINTTGYTNLKLSYKTIGNNPVDQNVLKVLCNDVAVTVPSAQIPDNKAYVTVTLTIPNNTSIIEFVSDTDNTIGMRLDDVKLVGTK